MEQALMIAWTVGIAVVYADVGENKRTLDKVRASMVDDPQLEGLTEFLIDRKRTLFW